MPLFDEYFPFDPGNGASANTARWRKMANLWQSDGVVAGYLNQLNASSYSAGASITIATGGCFVHGYYGEIVTAQSFTLSPGTNGTVVAQVSFVNETMSLYFKANATDYGPSTTLNFEQSANNWEIPLWLVSSGTLYDLRTMINPGMGLAWSGYSASTVTIASGSTVVTNIITPRIPHNAPALLTGTAVVIFNNLANAQSADCTLIYQSGDADQYPPTSMTGIPTASPGTGGGGTASSLSVPVSLSMLVPATTQGAKDAGWSITANSQTVQVAQMTITMQLIGTPSTS